MDKPWLERYDPSVPATIDYPDVTITERLATQAAAKPETVVDLYKGAELAMASSIGPPIRWRTRCSSLG
jgi:hypothetical protein